MSHSSAGSAATIAVSLDAAVVENIYAEWKRLHCGPRSLATILKKPRWKVFFLLPWLWQSHFRTAVRHTTVYEAARLATLFAWAFWQTRKQET